MAECRVYKRRWLMLALFVLCSMSNALQWIQYSIINNIIVMYYDVSQEAVNWTSMIFMVIYIPLIFPASWFLDKVGLRVYLTLGAAGTALGAWIKVASIPRHLFWVGFLGHSVVAVAQVFILGLPARLAAVWFGPGQVSSACAVGVFGNQLGVALGFVLPPQIVHNTTDPDSIATQLSIMFYSIAGFTTVLFLLIVLFFRAEPPLPPSAAQAVARDDTQADFLGSLRRLATNVNFVLLFLSYGVNVGVFYAISTLLNPVVLEHFPGHEQDAGWLGLVMVLAGMMGSVVCGVVLDKTHRFKETTLAVYILSLVGMVVYTFTLSIRLIWIVYLAITLLGFFMTGYLPVGFEFAAELTFPEPEGTSAGLLNASAQLFGIVFTDVYSRILSSVGDMYANIALCCALLLGTIMTAVIRSDLRRQKAQKGSGPASCMTISTVDGPHLEISS